jgi:hypothetical protein
MYVIFAKEKKKRENDEWNSTHIDRREKERERE